MKAAHWLEMGCGSATTTSPNSSAKSLDMPRIHLMGHLVSMWSGALEYAEDGDLWRESEEKTLRFIASLAEPSSDPERFVEVLRLDGWLDGWLIHDWLDYSGRYLISKYKSHNREKLTGTWAKHGRRYGREQTNSTSHGKLLGSEREADGTDFYPPYNPIPSILNPSALKNTKKESLKGGAGENAAILPEQREPTDFSNFSFQGSRVQGAVATQAELTGDGVTHKQVYEAFLPLLSFHSVLTLEAFYGRVKHCKTTPAHWMMLFLDKIHAIYRDRGGGTTLLDGEDADPVAMTVARLVPKTGRSRHQPTEAARQLFVEIMID